MRTTLSRCDDVLNAARVQARRELSARHGPDPAVAHRSGLPVLARRSDDVPVHAELVYQLRDETIE